MYIYRYVCIYMCVCASVCAILIPWCRHSPKYKGHQYPPRSYQGCFRNKASTKPTYPTLGKGKSSAKVPLGRDMLVPRRANFPNISVWAKLSLRCSGQEKVLMLSFHSSLAQIVNGTICQGYVPSGCDSKDLRPVNAFPMCWFLIDEIMEAIGHS